MKVIEKNEKKGKKRAKKKRGHIEKKGKD